jgi:hypothetical protein
MNEMAFTDLKVSGNPKEVSFCTTIKPEHQWFCKGLENASCEDLRENVLKRQKNGGLLVESTRSWSHETSAVGPEKVNWILSCMQNELPGTELSGMLNYQTLMRMMSHFKKRQWLLVGIGKTLTQTRSDCDQWTVCILELVFGKSWFRRRPWLEAKTFQALTAIPKHSKLS